MPSIKAVRNINYDNKPYKIGEIFDVSDDAAKSLVASGAAETVAVHQVPRDQAMTPAQAGISEEEAVAEAEAHPNEVAELVDAEQAPAPEVEAQDEGLEVKEVKQDGTVVADVDGKEQELKPADEETAEAVRELKDTTESKGAAEAKAKGKKPAAKKSK